MFCLDSALPTPPHLMIKDSFFLIVNLNRYLRSNPDLWLSGLLKRYVYSSQYNRDYKIELLTAETYMTIVTGNQSNQSSTPEAHPVSTCKTGIVHHTKAIVV